MDVFGKKETIDCSTFTGLSDLTTHYTTNMSDLGIATSDNPENSNVALNSYIEAGDYITSQAYVSSGYAYEPEFRNAVEVSRGKFHCFKDSTCVKTGTCHFTVNT